MLVRHSVNAILSSQYRISITNFSFASGPNWPSTESLLLLFKVLLLYTLWIDFYLLDYLS